MRAHEVPELNDGDVVVLSSPVVSTTVARVSKYYVFLSWPWKVPDPDSEFAWDGTVAFPQNPDSPEWRNTPWRFEPDTDELREGDEVRLSIPEVEFTVLSAERLERPKDMGWLPRPMLLLELCDTDHVDDEEAGFVLYCDTGEPISINVVG